MTDRLRLLFVMARPAVLVLLGLFAATGLAQAGGRGDPVLLLEAMAVVVGFLLFSVVVNDLSDEAIDRVNLPGDPRRPLVAGSCSRRELLAVGITAGVVALAASTLLHGPAPAVVAGGLALSLSYSLRPVRIADRGALASLLLPALYVAVPYLVGIFAVRGSLAADDLVLLAGLYAGFVGRILLKDFRDLKGDALFGKRTFLVRHGRRRTCATSAAFWVAGAALLAGVHGLTAALAGAYVLCVAVALTLLAALGADHGVRRDEALISALAIVGRGTIVLLLTHLTATGAGWSTAASSAVAGAVAVLTAGQAWTMATRGPRTRLAVPPEWALEAAVAGREEASPSPVVEGLAEGCQAS